MSTYKNLMTVCCVAALALGLAACGGGGSSTPQDQTQTTPDPAVVAAEAAIGAANMAAGMLDSESDDAAVTAAEGLITAAETAIAALPAGDQAAHTAMLAAAKDQAATQRARLTAQADADAAKKALDDEKKRLADEAAAAKAKEMAAVGKALYAALAGTTADANDNALANIGAPGLTAAGLAIDAAAGAGALADTTNPDPVTLTAGDSVGSLGSWAGTMYSHTSGSGPTKVTNEAVVYTNRGAHAGPSRSFSDVYDVIAAAGPTRGYTLLGKAAADDAGAATPVSAARADAFSHSGTQIHSAPPGMTAFTTRGTYNGAPGEFRCAGTDCASTNDGKAGPTSLAGTWHFKPDPGAMTSPADTTYLYYGWWVSKDSDDDPTAASAFRGAVVPTGGTAPVGVDGSSIGGSATYAGHAAGKFAITRTADGSNNGGHFTADATLEAKFGGTSVDGAGIKGTIDNFRLNDGEDDPGWSVKLGRGGWAAEGAITAPTANPTVWSIDGNAAAASGTWSGQMYDEAPGVPSTGGDGSNVPTTVTGTFYSEFGATHRMVGGFAAEKQ